MTDGHHDKDAEEFDPGSRALCPDGSCIGVLDSHGNCKVCGLQGKPPPTETSGDALAAGNVPTVVPASESSLDKDPLAADSAPEGDSDDFADRRLCADPGCIGVLDAAGRCKECGRTAS
jgi:hypothetical protein